MHLQANPQWPENTRFSGESAGRYISNRQQRRQGRPAEWPDEILVNYDLGAAQDARLDITLNDCILTVDRFLTFLTILNFDVRLY